MGPLVFGRIRSHKMGKKLNCKSEWVSKRSESVELRLEGREANFGKERIGQREERKRERDVWSQGGGVGAFAFSSTERNQMH